MTASPFHPAGPSITHSGHSSREKSNYVLTHQLPHSSAPAGENNIHTNLCSKNHHPHNSHLGILRVQGTLLCLGWRSDAQSLGKNKGRKESQHPSKGCRDRDGDKDGQGVQAVWFCTPPQRTSSCPQQAWSPCLCLMRSSAENVSYTELSRGLRLPYTHKTSTC